MSEFVTVTVTIPEQNFTFTYPREEWEQARVDGFIDHLMDCDISDMNINKDIYDEDGNLVKV